MCRILLNEDPDQALQSVPTITRNFPLHDFYAKVWPSRLYHGSAFQTQIWTIEVISEGDDLWHGTRLTSDFWFIPWTKNSQLEQKREMQTYNAELQNGFRDPVPFWPLDPGCVKSRSRSGIRNEYPGSYFQDLRNNFWVRDKESFWPGSRMMEKFGSGVRIRNIDIMPGFPWFPVRDNRSWSGYADASRPQRGEGWCIQRTKPEK